MLAARKPLACVLGDMDLVRPLGLAGIKCAVAVPPGAASRYSRFTTHSIEWAHPWEQTDELVEKLIQFGQSQNERPVLFFQSDGELLLVSRNRQRLAEVFPIRYRRSGVSRGSGRQGAVPEIGRAFGIAGSACATTLFVGGYKRLEASISDCGEAANTPSRTLESSCEIRQSAAY